MKSIKGADVEAMDTVAKVLQVERKVELIHHHGNPSLA